MIVNPNTGLLFIDRDEQYMKLIKDMLEGKKRLPGEIIHLVRSIDDGERILRERDTVELIALHMEDDKKAIRKALTRLRRISLAEIMVVALFEDENDISELYQYGMNMLVPTVCKPKMAVAYFESYIERHRLLPGISSMKDVEQIKNDAKMQCGGLTIDPAYHLVERDGAEINLTAKEYKLLIFFAQNANQLLSVDQIFDGVWETGNFFNSNLTSRISRLRAKIEPDPKNPAYIITKYGQGYLFQSK